MSLQGLPKRWTSVATVNGDAEHHSLDGLSSVPAGVGAEASFELVLQATRSLLWIKTEADACAVARELVENTPACPEITRGGLEEGQLVV